MNLVAHFNVLLMASTAVLTAEPFIEQPPDALTVTKGDTISIPCGIGSHIVATLSWQNMVTGELITKGAVIDPDFNFQPDKRDRYRINGDINIGEYNLQIRNVQGQDEGQYACFYYDESKQREQLSNIVTLTVMLPPEEGYPMCSMNPEFNQPGDTVIITCESRGGKPPAALTWIREQDILDVQYEPNQEISYYRKSVVLTEDDVDVKFICVARNPATKELPSCSIKPIRTSIVVNIEPESLEARPGEPAVLTCISEDIPKLEYFWYMNGRPVDDSQERFAIKRKGRRFVINPVVESDDLLLVTCVVEQYGPYNTATGSESALLRVEGQLYPDTSVPTIDIGFTDTVFKIDTTIVSTIAESMVTTDPMETSVPPTPTTTTTTSTVKPDGKHTTDFSIPAVSVSERPHGDARCRGDACFEVNSSAKPKVTPRLVTILETLSPSTTTEVSSLSSKRSSSTNTPDNGNYKTVFAAITTKTPFPDGNTNLTTIPPLKSATKPKSSSSRIVCPNGECAEISSKSSNRTETTTTDAFEELPTMVTPPRENAEVISNSSDHGNRSETITTDGFKELPAMVTPPRENGLKPKSTKPAGGQTDVIMPLMLTLALICFIVILFIIFMMILRKRRSPEQKVTSVENQRPIAVADGKYPPKSPAQGRSGLKNQNKYSKTCTSYSSIF